MKGYVIYLTELGYYTGKTYIHQGEMFAIVETISSIRKVYKNKKVAENAAIKLCQRCSNVTEYKVYELK